MSILIIAEHDNTALARATLSTAAAAAAIGGEIHVLVAGQDCRAVAEAAAGIEGVTKVLLAEAAHYANPVAEDLTELLLPLAKDYSHVLVPAGTFGKNLLPRLGGKLDVQPISEISAVVSADTFERPIYAGNAIATVQSEDAIKLISVRGSAFDPADSGADAAPIETIDAAPAAGLSEFLGQELTQSERPELTDATVVISGGRGLASKENFALLETVADRLGAAVGASRAAVDAGYAPNDYQVGQTGKIVAPTLYIAVGISGAIQHLAGMKDSKVVVAINKDPDAPIFQVADYGLVADLFQALPELADALA